MIAKSSAAGGREVIFYFTYELEGKTILIVPDKSSNDNTNEISENFYHGYW